MSSSRGLRVLIIGGGIAGPAVAMALHRLGWQPRIFEAYPQVEHVGGGFQIAPNGMRVLAQLGLADAVTAAGAIADEFCFRNHRGSVLARFRTARSGHAVTLMRDRFYRVILDGLARDGLAVEYGKRLADISYDGADVVARFDDGTTARGDLLVGADGIRSRVRGWLIPEYAAPSYTGMLAIGALGDQPPPAGTADPRALNFMMGPKYLFGYASAYDAAPLWGWWCHLPQDRELPRAELLALTDGELRRRVHEAFAGWAPPVDHFLRAGGAIQRTAIYDVPGLPRWSGDRVVLVGDAAHAMSPAGGQGASLALEDAARLARVLATDRPLAESLAAYERARRPRAEAMVREARKTDQRALAPHGPVGQWFRDRVMFPLIAPLIARGLEKHYAAEP